MISIPTVTLNDGVSFPQVGLGTYNLRGAAGSDAIVAALDTGYRLLDSAVNYENEREVGEGIKASGVPREEIFLTTKLNNPDQRKPLAALEYSLQQLETPYLDLCE